MYFVSNLAASTFLNFTLFLVLLGMPRSGTAQALSSQKTSPVRSTFLTRPQSFTLQKATLQDVFSTLNQKTGINFVADGEPLTVGVGLDLHGTGREILDRIADVFDCRWKMVAPSVIVFNKRFRNSMDLPQLHPAELAHVAREIVSDLSVFPYDLGAEQARRRLEFGVDWQPMLFDLLRSFTPEQVQALKAGQRLTTNQLLPQQLALEQDAVLTCVLAPARNAWGDLFYVFSGIDRDFLRIDIYNKKVTSLSLLNKDRELLGADIDMQFSKVTSSDEYNP